MAGAEGSGDPTGHEEEAGNPLQRLIGNRLRERGWSYGIVARRGGLPRSTVYHLAVTPRLVRPPRPDTLEGLARGLELPIALVRSAAADAAGLHYYGGVPLDQETAVLVASLEELTPEDRRHVAALVESMRRRASSSAGESPRQEGA